MSRTTITTERLAEALASQRFARQERTRKAALARFTTMTRTGE